MNSLLWTASGPKLDVDVKASRLREHDVCDVTLMRLRARFRLSAPAAGACLTSSAWKVPWLAVKVGRRSTDGVAVEREERDEALATRDMSHGGVYVSNVSSASIRSPEHACAELVLCSGVQLYTAPLPVAPHAPALTSWRDVDVAGALCESMGLMRATSAPSCSALVLRRRACRAAVFSLSRAESDASRATRCRRLRTYLRNRRLQLRIRLLHTTLLRR